jgi:ATP-dependent helicase/nuclease subunit A
VVVFADLSCSLVRRRAARHIDPTCGLCAVRLAGCTPVDLLRNEAAEIAKDEAESMRVAYVAATRARDLLVIPVVGDTQGVTHQMD